MSKHKVLMICMFLTIATLAAFWRVNYCDFNNYDDQDYITENDHVRNGITLEGIRWAFTTGHAANWHPLTWISHMMDVQLFGLQPRWHHLTNLLFHIANTLLLFLVLHRMTKAYWESAFVAVLFALHPLHVESVAFMAERKDVLSGLFWMLTLGAYVWYVERPGIQRYLFVVFLFMLGLMAKPMLVTLPFVLLLLDYWPLNRFRIKSDQKGDGQKEKSKKKHSAGEEVRAKSPTDSKYRWALIRPLLREKIPLFALTAMSCILTYLVQQQGGAVASFDTIPLDHRIANAFVSYMTYMEKTIWPQGLAVLYPYALVMPVWQVIGASCLLIAVTVTAVRKAGTVPYLAVGWLWYVGTLVPVIGIVQVGAQAWADRYTYLPLIGLFIILAWGISEHSKTWRYRKETLVAASTAVLLCLSVVTWIQTGYWRNSITLFEHDLNVTKNNYIAHYNRGTAYAHLGNYQRAIEDYGKAIEIKPEFAQAYSNRGNAYAYLGDYRRAIGDYDKTLAINPRHGNAYNNRGNAYVLLGDYRQSIGDYDMAIEVNPTYAEAYSNRANAYVHLGNDSRAIEDLKTAARLGYQHAQDLLKKRGMDW